MKEDKQIKAFRKQIQQIDKKIVLLIKKRLSISKKIGMLKKSKQLPLVNKKAENQVKQNINNIITKNKMPPSLGYELAKLLIKYSIKIQKS